MRVIIAGGRDYNNFNDMLGCVDFYLSKQINQAEIVSGGAKGADALGEMYADTYNCKLTVFPANWDKYGKGAGYKRNTQMAEYADALIAFWDGKSKGTKMMIDIAKSKGLKVRVNKY